jgi:glycosyltransferase involved in cell wall biosynthesis
MRAAALVPAFDAERSVGQVVAGLAEIWPDRDAVFVVDDGSRDRTAARAQAAGAAVVAHERNLGKGAALRTGLRAAGARGFDVAVTLDADGQHLPAEALRLRQCCDDPDALILGVRDMAAAGAPWPNRMSNAFSNLAVSAYAFALLRDTQCGLRRYPIAATLALSGRDDGFAFEAEVLIRAAAAAMRIVQVPIRVYYPPEPERVTHFDALRDPARIAYRVLGTWAATRPQWLHHRLGRARSPVARVGRPGQPPPA